MIFNKDAEQFFSWTLQLTAQQDFQALTHKFLDILQSIPGIDKAIAYEIYNHDTKRAGEAETITEQLISRFPMDFTKEINEKFNILLGSFDLTVELNFSEPDANGYYTWAIMNISNGNGPDRAVVVNGHFNKPLQNLLTKLRSFYSNLVLLHDAKERDVLTRLLNRQSLDTRLFQVCEYYCLNPILDKTTQPSSWIAVLDIDHFKRVNDNFGHLFGDEVLLLFSQIMGKNFRYNDFLFRFGGEEFVVILNLATQSVAEATFNRFREAIANYDFPTVGRITVSIGVTHVDSRSMPSTLLDRADKALYQAKNTGRNKVVLYEELVEEQPTPANLEKIDLFDQA